MKTLKHSRQRECIKDCLMSRKDHPTAEMVYTSVREIFPNISLGTVYRNLTLLTEMGEIQKISGIGESERFDGNPERHYHFCCQDCGCVSDIDMYPLDHINIIAAQNFGGHITGHAVTFTGICESCLKESKTGLTNQ